MNTVLLPINEYLNKLENADNNIKNEIENELVSIGKDAVPSLVDSLQIVKGKTKQIITLIQTMITKKRHIGNCKQTEMKTMNFQMKIKTILKLKM